MKLRLLPVVLMLLCLTGGTVFGSVVGKITGMVTDVQSMEPLVGVTVSIQGTTMGAITKDDGSYTIQNVPVGTYVLVISAVGYATVEVSNIHVTADLATYHDQEMSSKAADLGKTITVTAERPMVVKDKTTTVNIIGREELQAMPTRGIEQVVGIQNSVVRMNAGAFGQRQRSQRASRATNTELNLRGGRPSEVAYYVDGFSQQDPLTGISSVNVSNNAVKEVTVTSGAFSAEYGHVASGIVNVVTNSGSPEYHGNLDVLTDNISSESFDHNYYSADISGPIPGLDNAYFFVSGERRFLRDRTPSSKTKEMHQTWGRPLGLDTLYEDNPQRLPNNHINGWSGQVKLNYDASPNLRLEAMGNMSIDNWQEYFQTFALNSMHNPRTKDENYGLNFKVTHTLSANTFYNVSASYFQYKRLRSDGVVFDDYEALTRPHSNPEFEPFSLFWTPAEERSWRIPNDTTANPNDSIDVTRDVVSYSPGFNKRSSSYIGFKGDINHQLDDNNTVKAGFDFQRHTLRDFLNLDATQQRSIGNLLNRYGYDSLGNVSDDEDFKNETKHPINIGLYVQDRFEWRGLVVNAGLRFDFFDYKALRLKNVTRPFESDSLGSSTLDRADLEDSKKFYRVSPRLGISFPVSDKTQMHINFGKFFQRPDLNRLYCGYDFLENRIGGGSYYPFPSPNLEPEKTTQYEVGLTHQLGENVALDIVAYYKDVQGLTQIFHQSPAYPFVYDFYGNTDFGTIKGVDFSLTMKRTKNIRMDLKYTLSYATGTGSYDRSTYIIAWQNPDGFPKTTNPLDYDQRHNITGIFDVRTGAKEGPKMGDIYPLENFGLNMIVYAGSGTPYTPSAVYDECTEDAVQAQPQGSINSANKPWNFFVDVKLERSFKFGSLDMTPYFWIKNVLNTENVIGVYESSGQPDVCGYLDTDQGRTNVENSRAAGTQYLEKYRLKENDPTNYSNPRMWFAGLRLSF